MDHLGASCRLQQRRTCAAPFLRRVAQDSIDVHGPNLVGLHTDSVRSVFDMPVSLLLHDYLVNEDELI